jgi:hypothetical protein
MEHGTVRGQPQVGLQSMSWVVRADFSFRLCQEASSSQLPAAAPTTTRRVTASCALRKPPWLVMPGMYWPTPEVAGAGPTPARVAVGQEESDHTFDASQPTARPIWPCKVIHHLQCCHTLYHWVAHAAHQAVSLRPQWPRLFPQGNTVVPHNLHPVKPARVQYEKKPKDRIQRPASLSGQ